EIGEELVKGAAMLVERAEVIPVDVFRHVSLPVKSGPGGATRGRGPATAACPVTGDQPAVTLDDTSAHRRSPAHTLGVGSGRWGSRVEGGRPWPRVSGRFIG